MKKLLVGLVMLASCAVPNHARRYCVIVESVKHIRNNKSKIKALNRWYWYPTQNVNVGDTVDVSANEMIIPKF